MNSSDLILSAAVRMHCSVTGAMGTRKLELVSTRISIQDLMEDTGRQYFRKENPKLKLCRNNL